MNSIGGFHEGEIDGKPFHIYSFISQTDIPSSSSDEAAIDSGGDDLPPPLEPLFTCQSFRSSDQWLLRRVNDPNREDFVPVDAYPLFFDKRSGDQQFQFLIGSDIYDHPCKLPLVPLFWCNNQETDQVREFRCGVCKNSNYGTDYLFCVTCGKMFHKECIESPLEIKHPCYPFLSLKLYYPPYNHSGLLICLCCQRNVSEMLYYCPTYKIIMHPICSMKPIPIVIDHPKRHPHPLTFFPKQNSLACDVCGLINELIPTYVCARSVFVVHQDCIYFPYVIRISRHQHRISFTSSLGKWSCGVCRRNVDNNCGAYSCNKCDDYFVHPRCATRRDLWDGEELEGVPEEPEIVVEPFERIADGIIHHFSHGHYLKLVISRDYDEEIFCQACVFPIYEGNYYACMDQCDFILHEPCATSPLKKHYPLHARPLTLKVVTNGYDNNNKGFFRCFACWRESCGFIYESEDPKTRGRFKLDLRCASVSEPFEYKGHDHPLFLALKPEEEKSAICQICEGRDKYGGFYRKLNCIDCNFVICFKCATLPYKARYKHDKHFLTFQKKGEAGYHSHWCEVCETKIDNFKENGLYSCDDCCTTLHIDCFLGKDLYMKPGQTIMIHREEVQILRNNTMSRPFCRAHNKYRCPDRVVFEKKDMICCSLYCTMKRY